MALSKKDLNKCASLLNDMSLAFYDDNTILGDIIEIKLMLLDASVLMDYILYRDNIFISNYK